MKSIFTGFETKEITLNKGTNVEEGTAVMLSENGTAVLPSASEAFCGVCTAVRGDYASVILHGCAKAAYSGTAPSVGYCKLSADGNGGVKEDENGREHLVVSVDTENSTVEFIV